MTIADKSVLVTGANRGIGRALVEEALKRGAKRVYAGTRQPLAHSDRRVTPLALDVTDAAQIQAAVEKRRISRRPHQQCRRRHLRRSEQSRRDRTALGGQLSRLVESDACVLAAAEALQRGHRQQPVPGGARCIAGHTLLLHFKGSRVQHDAVPAGRSWRARA